HVVVSSEKMVRIFQESFGLSDARMLRTGIPRTDFFYQFSDRDFKDIHPLIHQKNVILYAPTFRDDLLHSADIAVDIDQLYRELRDEYVLLLRLHPAVRGTFVNQYPDF